MRAALPPTAASGPERRVALLMGCYPFSVSGFKKKNVNAIYIRGKINEELGSFFPISLLT